MNVPGWRRWVVCLFVLMSIAGISGQQECFAASSEIETDDVRITLQHTEDIAVPGRKPTGHIYTFGYLNKRTQTQIPLVVRAQYTQELVGLIMYHRSLLVWGKLMNTAGDSIQRINLNTLEEDDRILMYYPAFSPDNRFVVYVAHYPRSLPSNAVPTSIVKVYDFEQPPSDNRVHPEGRDPGYVGIPVFPEEDARTLNEDFVVYDHERRVYSVSPPFLWLNNQRQVVFLAYDDSQGKQGEYANFLVRLDLDQGVRQPHIVRRRIDSSLSPAFRDGIPDPIVVKELAEDGNAIVITTYRNYGPRPAGIDPQKEKASEQIIRLPKSVFE